MLNLLDIMLLSLLFLFVKEAFTFTFLNVKNCGHFSICVGFNLLSKVKICLTFVK